MNADIAHIKGERPGAARYDDAQTPRERNGFANLMLLCPKDHRRIDRLEPERHTVELLDEMKRLHEERAENPGSWTSLAQLFNFARQALEDLISRPLSTVPQTDVTGIGGHAPPLSYHDVSLLQEIESGCTSQADLKKRLNFDVIRYSHRLREEGYLIQPGRGTYEVTELGRKAIDETQVVWQARFEHPPASLIDSVNLTPSAWSVLAFISRNGGVARVDSMDVPYSDGTIRKNLRNLTDAGLVEVVDTGLLQVTWRGLRAMRAMRERR